MIIDTGRPVSVRARHRAIMCLIARNRLIRSEKPGLAGVLQQFSPLRNKTSLSKVESGVRNFDEDDLTVEISKRILESGWLNVCGRVGPLPPPRGRQCRGCSVGGSARSHTLEPQELTQCKERTLWHVQSESTSEPRTPWSQSSKAV